MVSYLFRVSNKAWLMFNRLATHRYKNFFSVEDLDMKVQFLKQYVCSKIAHPHAIELIRLKVFQLKTKLLRSSHQVIVCVYKY